MKTEDIKKEKGMVTIEASIALTSFLFMFMMIYSIVTICRAQARIQVALNNTAQEISQYSYIYGLTGLDKSLAKFEGEGAAHKDKVNNFVGDAADLFEGIQTLGDDAKTVDISNMDSVMDGWEKISEDLDSTEADAEAIKQQIEEMADDPQKLLFGMGKLIGSEVLEAAKSRIIAEPITRALIQKHLKRSSKDTADAFCQSIGIVPGSFFGKTSYFNGIDFSRSLLFPWGSEEITLVATYKVKLLQLIPLDMEFTITQTASTKGWLHGDGTKNSASDIIDQFSEGSKDTETIPKTLWNSRSDRDKVIRTKELQRLKDEDGYSSVSDQTIIHAYRESDNKVVFIRSFNPIYELDSADEIDKEYVRERISAMVTQMKSTSDRMQYIKIKVPKENGGVTVKEVRVNGTELKKEIILFVPEDSGVDKCVQEIANEFASSGVTITVKAAYGTGKKLPENDGAETSTAVEGG